MVKHSNEHFVVFDNDMNCNIFDIDTMQSEWETEQEAFEVAKVWKEKLGHKLTLKCIYTVEREYITW